jgi:hypothetical protein
LSLPPIREFILSDQYLDLGGIVCDAVLENLERLFAPDADYREAVFDWGIGAGKSFLVSIISVYLAYRLLSLPDPQKHYGLAPGSEISVTNFSVDQDQAKDVVFGEIGARIEHAPCFDQPGFKPDPRIKSVLRWPEKSFVIRPAGKEYRKALGKNLLGGVMDEAAFMEVVHQTRRTAGRMRHGQYDAAEEVYNAVQARIKSRGNALWRKDGLVVMISSPCFVEDFIERKMTEAVENPRIFSSRLPTWEGAQKKTLCGETFLDSVLGPVPVEYVDDFKRDPERARRDLGARPSEAIQPFFTDAEALYDAKDENLRSILDGLVLREGVEFGPEPRFAHVDLGIVHDRAGVAVGHLEGQRLVYDFATYFEAADFDAGEVDLEHIRQLFISMRDAGCRFAVVSYDGFQSFDSLQLLKKARIPSELLSVDRTTQPYDDLKALLYGGRVGIPVDARSEMFFTEARKVELIDGKKIDHPPHGSKDVADAVAGVASHAALRLGLRTPDINRMMEARGDASSSLTGTNATTGEETNLPESKDAPDVTAVFGTAATDVTPTVLETMYPAFKSFRRKQPPPS